MGATRSLFGCSGANDSLPQVRRILLQSFATLAAGSGFGCGRGPLGERGCGLGTESLRRGKFARAGNEMRAWPKLVVAVAVRVAAGGGGGGGGGIDWRRDGAFREVEGEGV